MGMGKAIISYSPLRWGRIIVSPITGVADATVGALRRVISRPLPSPEATPEPAKERYAAMVDRMGAEALERGARKASGMSWMYAGMTLIVLSELAMMVGKVINGGWGIGVVSVAMCFATSTVAVALFFMVLRERYAVYAHKVKALPIFTCFLKRPSLWFD